MKCSKYGKFAISLIVIFTLMCLLAFSNEKFISGIIALTEIGLAIVSILMKKEIIKVPNNKIYIVMIILAIVLIIPYFQIYNIDYGNARNFQWNEIVLGEIIPETKSHFGGIYTNSNESLSLYVYKTNFDQYNKYISQCQEKGFTIDLEQTSYSFRAYNNEGYELSLHYLDSKRMDISLNATEKLGMIEWPDNEYASLLPVPTSKVGKIIQNSDSGFSVVIGETSREDFKSYIKLCTDKGFTVDKYETDKSYSARNADGYKLFIEHKGNDLMNVYLSIPEYKIKFEVNCTENLIFSKYDVKVLIDDIYEGTLKHGVTETYSVTLKRGTHKIKFVNIEDSNVTGEVSLDNISKDETIKININCTNSKIDIKVVDGNDRNSEPLTTVDVKGLTLDVAKAKLKDIGFTNVTEKADNGDFIFIDSNWTVIEQNVEVGVDIDRTTEIILTCHKEEAAKPEEPIQTIPEVTPEAPVQTQPQTDEYGDSSHQYDAEDVFLAEIRDNCPYGVKIHRLKGWLAQTYEGNGVWFFKINITVTNAFNAKIDMVAEGRVDASNGNNITYFIIY